MSETRQTFLALMEEDPELSPVAPLVRAILETPSESLAAFHSLLELWARLTGDRRALLAMSLIEGLTVTEAARLVNVHRRTLYKSEQFRKASSLIRSSRGRSLPRGVKSFEDEGADFDAWEDD